LRKEREEEERRAAAEAEPELPWWSRHIGRLRQHVKNKVTDFKFRCNTFEMGETTPPPEDIFPKVNYDDSKEM